MDRSIWLHSDSHQNTRKKSHEMNSNIKYFQMHKLARQHTWHNMTCIWMGVCARECVHIIHADSSKTNRIKWKRFIIIIRMERRRYEQERSSHPSHLPHHHHGHRFYLDGISTVGSSHFHFQPGYKFAAAQKKRVFRVQKSVHYIPITYYNFSGSEPSIKLYVIYICMCMYICIFIQCAYKNSFTIFDRHGMSAYMTDKKL